MRRGEALFQEGIFTGAIGSYPRTVSDMYLNWILGPEGVEAIVEELKQFETHIKVRGHENTIALAVAGALVRKLKEHVD